jgi:hypothetical protein
MQSKGAPRRRHGKALKAQVLTECTEPGAPWPRSRKHTG